MSCFRQAKWSRMCSVATKCRVAAIRLTSWSAKCTHNEWLCRYDRWRWCINFVVDSSKSTRTAQPSSSFGPSRRRRVVVVNTISTPFVTENNKHQPIVPMDSLPTMWIIFVCMLLPVIVNTLGENGETEGFSTGKFEWTNNSIKTGDSLIFQVTGT